MSDLESGSPPQNVPAHEAEDDEYRHIVSLSSLPTGFPAYRSPGLTLPKDNDVYLDFIPKAREPEKVIRRCTGLALTLIMLWLTATLLLDISATLTEGRPAFETLRLRLSDSGFVLRGVALAGIAMAGSIAWGIWSWTRPHPVRFNRQRREMAYVNDTDLPPFFMPWEEVRALVRTVEIETVLGPLQIHVLNLFLFAEDDDQKSILLSSHSSLEMAIGEWESIRLFMERGRKFLPDNKVTHEVPADAFELFRMQRQLCREFHGYPRYLLLFVLPNLLCGWTLPFHIAKWIKKLPRSSHSKEMEEWSQSIPLRSWKRADEWHLYQSAEMHEYFQAGGTLMDYQREILKRARLDEDSSEDANS
ncbi:hypothetical protein PS3A_58790 [Pseudomonas sp. 3A(2025)]